MNSMVLRLLAAALAVGALVVGYVGYRASQSPEPAAPITQSAPPPEPARDETVFAARAIPPGRAITAEDLSLVRVPQRPVRAYTSKETVLGQTPWTEIAAGEMLLSGHFVHKSPLAQVVRPGERAVAVQVDEVIGTGGFVMPGDEVDVLLYLRADKETGERSSAQVVLQQVRVLAFGNQLETAPGDAGSESERDPTATSSLTAKGSDKSAPQSDSEEPTGKKSKSAVLAVPEAATARLMLAESSGKLRLALHAAQASAPPVAPAVPSANHYVALQQLAFPPRTGSPARITPTARGPQVVVHRGDRVEVVEPTGTGGNSPGLPVSLSGAAQFAPGGTP